MRRREYIINLNHHKYEACCSSCCSCFCFCCVRKWSGSPVVARSTTRGSGTWATLSSFSTPYLYYLGLFYYIKIINKHLPILNLVLWVEKLIWFWLIFTMKSVFVVRWCLTRMRSSSKTIQECNFSS